MENTEIWKDVVGYEEVYQVSDLGRVRSLDQFFPNRKGSGKQTGRVLKLSVCHKGYLRVSLSKYGNRFKTGVHRLVALAFIPNFENKPQVNHIDGNKQNNNLNNLEWCTNAENQKHAVQNGLAKPTTCEKHHMSKLSNSQVEICRLSFEMGAKCKDLARMYGVSNTAMNNILRKKTYTNI